MSFIKDFPVFLRDDIAIVDASGTKCSETGFANYLRVSDTSMSIYGIFTAGDKCWNNSLIKVKDNSIVVKPITFVADNGFNKLNAIRLGRAGEGCSVYQYVIDELADDEDYKRCIDKSDKTVEDYLLYKNLGTLVDVLYSGVPSGGLEWVGSQSSNNSESTVNLVYDKGLKKTKAEMRDFLKRSMQPITDSEKAIATFFNSHKNDIVRDIHSGADKSATHAFLTQFFSDTITYYYGLRLYLAKENDAGKYHKKDVSIYYNGQIANL